MHKLNMFATLGDESSLLSNVKGSRVVRNYTKPEANSSLHEVTEPRTQFYNDRKTVIEALFKAVHYERIRHLMLPAMDIIVHPHNNIGPSQSIRILCKTPVAYDELADTLFNDEDRLHSSCSNHNFVSAEITLEHRPGSEIVVLLRQQYPERRQESAFAQDIRHRLQVLFSDQTVIPPLQIKAETPRIRQTLMDIFHHSRRVQSRLRQIGLRHISDDRDKGVIVVR